MKENIPVTWSTVPSFPYPQNVTKVPRRNISSFHLCVRCSNNNFKFPFIDSNSLLLNKRVSVINNMMVTVRIQRHRQALQLPSLKSLMIFRLIQHSIIISHWLSILNLKLNIQTQFKCIIVRWYTLWITILINCYVSWYCKMFHQKFVWKLKICEFLINCEHRKYFIFICLLPSAGWWLLD